jgi:hypothetical protein
MGISMELPVSIVLLLIAVIFSVFLVSLWEQLYRAVYLTITPNTTLIYELFVPLSVVGVLYGIAFAIGKRTLEPFLGKLVEGTAIACITFIILVVVRAGASLRPLKDTDAWIDYRQTITTANRIRAISTSPVRYWFSPIGFKYFVEQVMGTESRQSQERLLVIDDRKNIKIYDSWAAGGLKNIEAALTMEQRDLRNLVMLHTKHSITLYLVTKAAILERYPNYSYSLREIDRLLIDDKCFYPHRSKGRLFFSEDDERRDVISKLCSELMCEENRLDTIMKKLS